MCWPQTRCLELNRDFSTLVLPYKKRGRFYYHFLTLATIFLPEGVISDSIFWFSIQELYDSYARSIIALSFSEILSFCSARDIRFQVTKHANRHLSSSSNVVVPPPLSTAEDSSGYTRCRSCGSRAQILGKWSNWFMIISRLS